MHCAPLCEWSYQKYEKGTTRSIVGTTRCDREGTTMSTMCTHYTPMLFLSFYLLPICCETDCQPLSMSGRRL